MWEESETEEHVFFHCTFSRSIWITLYKAAGYDRNMATTWEQEMAWVRTTSKGKGLTPDALKLTFNAFIYWTWKERNYRIFKAETRVVTHVAQLALRDVGTKLHSITWKMDLGPNRERLGDIGNIDIDIEERTEVTCTWERTGPDITILNTDGSLQGNIGRWAAVARDHSGLVLVAAKGRSIYNNIALIELQGLEKGLHMIKEAGIKKVYAQTDSTNVVSFLKTNKVPWEARHMFRRVKELINWLEEFSIVHVFREAN
ncbi:hypothetical protein FRX31_016100, partial [Thalictrum thalictroides]